MNATAWQDYRSIWTAATFRRDSRSCVWMNRGALLLALAAGMARMAGVLDKTKFLRLETLVVVGWFALLWVIYFLPSSVQMNSAPNARLVPRQRARLRQMAGAGWLLLSAGMSMVFGAWTAFPIFAAYVLGMMLARAGIRWAIIFVVVPQMWPFIAARLPAHWLQLLTGTSGLVIESAGLALFALWGLAVLYPAGGDRHIANRERILSGLKRFEGRAMGDQAGRSWLNRFAYIPALQRDCWQGKPQALLIHALGPGAHWSSWIPVLTAVLFTMLTIALVITFSDRTPAPDFIKGFGFGASWMTVLAVFATAQYTQQMGRTTGEQALLRLTPLAGDAALLNRRLAAGFLRAALVNWSMVTVMLLLVIWAAGGDATLLLREFALCCLGGQLSAAGLFGDFARQLPTFGIKRMLIALLQAGVNVGLAYGLAQIAGSVWVWLVPVSLIGTVILLVRSRRTMLGAPPAFPAGRMEQINDKVKQ